MANLETPITGSVGSGRKPLSGTDQGDGTAALNVHLVGADTGADAAQIQGNVAHDAADSGNPVKIGFKAESGTPAATADGDRSDWHGTLYGAGFVNPVTSAGEQVTGATGAAVPVGGVLASGTDGTNLRGLKTDSDGKLQINVTGSSAIYDGTGSAPLSGVNAVALTAQACNWIILQNDPDSGADLMVGKGATSTPFQVLPGQGITMPVTNTNLVFVRSSSASVQPTYNWIAG